MWAETNSSAHSPLECHSSCRPKRQQVTSRLAATCQPELCCSLERLTLRPRQECGPTERLPGVFMIPAPLIKGKHAGVFVYRSCGCRSTRKNTLLPRSLITVLFRKLAPLARVYTKRQKDACCLHLMSRCFLRNRSPGGRKHIFHHRKL